MSKETEKLIKIILPDLLNYLEMLESGEIIEKRMEKNFLLGRKKDEDNETCDINQIEIKNI